MINQPFSIYRPIYLKQLQYVTQNIPNVNTLISNINWRLCEKANNPTQMHGDTLNTFKICINDPLMSQMRKYMSDVFIVH